MTLPPGYGETPIPDDEMQWLLPGIRELLGEPVTKAAVNDLEQAIQSDVAEQLPADVLAGTLALDELLSDRFCVNCTIASTVSYGPGPDGYRLYELNIGVAPAQIAMDLHAALGNFQWRWHHTDRWVFIRP